MRVRSGLRPHPMYYTNAHGQLMMRVYHPSTVPAPIVAPRVMPIPIMRVPPFIGREVIPVKPEYFGYVVRDANVAGLGQHVEKCPRVRRH